MKIGDFKKLKILKMRDFEKLEIFFFTLQVFKLDKKGFKIRGFNKLRFKDQIY